MIDIKTLHFRNQSGQPYGSESRKCDRCGTMLLWRDAAYWKQNAFVEDAADYHDNHAGHTTCETLHAK